MPKLQDVADYAQVSITTVSRVLNNPGRVNADTRRRVQNAIQKLDYRPNRVAQRLRWEHGRTHLIGLIIPDINNPFYSDLVRGVEDIAYGQNYAVILCNTDENPERERFYMNVLRAESVDGVILAPMLKDRQPAVDLTNPDLPIVCFDRRPSTSRVDTVIVDNHAGAYEATEHLIKLGHERIGGIFGPLDLSTSVERIGGYRQALRDHGISIDEALIMTGAPAREAGYALTTKMMEMSERPSAMFTGNNVLTLGAMEALKEIGIRIPEEIAIVGFDDVPWAKLVTPPLTAVRQPSYEMGRRASEMLLSRLREPQRDPVLITLHPQLIVRGSCGCQPD